MKEPSSILDQAMADAIKLATQARGHTAPNPMVGAVLLKDGRVVGRGYHIRAGEPHAEVVAIEDSKKNLSQFSETTLVVTLEPCGHFGRTPPCVDKILGTGIQNVVIGALDPNPLMQGKSIEKLKRHGVNVEFGVLQKECEKLIRGFASVIKDKRPFVTLKCATSLDGKIATAAGESQWITDEPARAVGHQERAEHDTILVGVGTVLADDPQLNVRLPEGSRPIRKVILDSQLRTPANAKIFKSGDQVLIYCDWNYPEMRRAELERAGAVVIPSGSPRDSFSLDRIRLQSVLEDLALRGAQELLVEGGARVLGAFVREKLFDRVVYFIAPKIFGSESRDVFEGFEAKTLKESVVLKDLSTRLVGSDVIIEGSRNCLLV